MDDEVQFEGSIQVFHEDDDAIILAMDGQEISLDLEEAAVLTYQLQLTLKAIQESKMTRAIKGVADGR